MAMEFCSPDDPTSPGTALVGAVIDACRERGLLVIPAGVDGNVIRVLAPLVISDDALAAGLDILEQAVLEHGRAPATAAVQGG